MNQSIMDKTMNTPIRVLAHFAFVAVFAARLPAADIYIGSGVKAGEITDRTAIVLVRLTTTPGQNAEGLIPGREGQARLHYAADQSLSSPTTTNWEAVRPDADWSIQFQLRELKPATRYFYRVEFRTGAN